jgi:CHAT domain-containing protein
LHQAQLGFLHKRRGEKGDKPAHPLFWAAFVLIGDGK